MPSDTSAWSLHSQLKKDTIDIGDLPLCRVLVIKDAHYPWLLLVPRREGAVEIIDLDEVEQAQLMTEVSRVARALKEITKCDKLNIAALGNLVPQLHVHVIARRTSDAAWPRPVWGVMPPLRTTPRKSRISSARFAARSGWVEHHVSIRLISPGRPAFVTHILDRAAHLRTNDEKLFALEGQRDARAYVVYRDSLVMKQEESGPRALLSIKEALKLGANPGTIFLGLRDGAPVFGMGISPAAAEKLIGRNDVAVTELRGMAMQGVLPLEQLSAIAMAKSMVSWHQRHGFCANCGARTAMKEGGWKRECAELQGRAFSAHRPGRDHAGQPRATRRCSAGRSSSCPACIRAWPASSKPPRPSRTPSAARSSRNPASACTDVNYYMTQPWPYPSSLMIGCTARAISEDIIVDRIELEDARWFDRAEVGSHAQARSIPTACLPRIRSPSPIICSGDGCMGETKRAHSGEPSMDQSINSGPRFRREAEPT